MSFASNFRNALRQKYRELIAEGKKPQNNTPVFWEEQMSVNSDRILKFFHGTAEPEDPELKAISDYFGVKPDWFNEDHSNDTSVIKIAYVKGEEKDLDDDFDEFFEAVDYAKGINKKYNKN